ncbi:hypothetical protein ACFXDE_01750 [Kitasatospora sp. NPDC059408]|uniref:hypothetical protein n=1 Tax=Kitasatospora sp. NPDC059408 TaxID=3346823 RepID=UPI0036CE6EFE
MALSPIETVTIHGRAYAAVRCGPHGHSSWNVIGIAPQPTPAELALPEPRRPRLPWAYGSPVAPSRGHVGHPEAPITDGWQVRDELNRTIFGYAQTIAEIAQITANALNLPGHATN